MKGHIIALNVFLWIVGMFTFVALLMMVEHVQGSEEDLGGIWHVSWFIFIIIKTKIELIKNKNNGY